MPRGALVPLPVRVVCVVPAPQPPDNQLFVRIFQIECLRAASIRIDARPWMAPPQRLLFTTCRFSLFRTEDNTVTTANQLCNGYFIVFTHRQRNILGFMPFYRRILRLGSELGSIFGRRLILGSNLALILAPEFFLNVI